VPAARRSARDERRRRLGQNFLLPWAAERFVAEADVRPGELVVDIGAGSGAISIELARRGARVVAVEADPVWPDRLHGLGRREGDGRLRVVHGDFFTWPLPDRPYRVVACPPFGSTTAIMRRLLDHPEHPLVRADLIVQWEVARKRAAIPPGTLISTTWAPWWEFRSGRRIPAADFRPVPRVDAGALVVTRRAPPLLPARMADAYVDFVAQRWPFG
jgi:23S rRNA (adenine-N6)-dimethyltransferase